jgi:hypothetical protein
MTAVMDDKDMQDWVADYNGEWTIVANNAGDSGVAMMAAMVEGNGSRQQWQWRTIAVADDGCGR